MVLKEDFQTGKLVMKACKKTNAKENATWVYLLQSIWEMASAPNQPANQPRLILPDPVVGTTTLLVPQVPAMAKRGELRAASSNVRNEECISEMVSERKDSKLQVYIDPGYDNRTIKWGVVATGRPSPVPSPW